MTNLIIGLAHVTLVVSGSPTEPASQWRPPVQQIRLVCDQNCNCWHTRYHERRPLLAGHDDLACPTSRPGRVGYYNGYYRSGPATGVDFYSRYPVRGFAFPF
ncbi:hypothetical protein JQ615_03250 [Bradyrhizobium jicamae]|uniref:Secreted protein n=1 Tax=Bradyrhizobium jicamae TaxID=280332 RepID=A0ABS5FC94_9BRAD|nr:hypothetical protein [Bradyrhizobium jicamae]MBR0794399.1 hypothetical protein [Bradyrhizobium jicamae]MBR0933549.1 hypothetical protein [Bradyrhizobium jicamae]